MTDIDAQKLSYSGRSGNLAVPRKPKKVSNPLQAGVLNFLSKHSHFGSLELNDIPKRYTRYGSLLLLGPTFTTHSAPWVSLWESLAVNDRTDLFRSMTGAFNDDSLTHVAINAPISAIKSDCAGGQFNVVRSPTGLQPVYGDFGPGIGECHERYPTKADLSAAYWTQTVQLNNITQVWAPRWTMFSRGNISEKARILQDSLSNSPFPGLYETELGENITNIDVVDFYVGIGYFAFCYLSRGAARVWGWEINGWSVEGLRRGCVKNGWGVRTIRIDKDGKITDGGSVADLVNDIRLFEDSPEAIRCIIFWGDNKWAAKLMTEVKSLMDRDTEHKALNVRHCNLGLLPSSEDSWNDAVRVLNCNRGGWLHVHANVEISAIATKCDQIVARLAQYAHVNSSDTWSITCEHTEQVKTYAPGVMHCVYDIMLCPFQ